MFEKKGGVFIWDFFNCCGAEMNHLNQRSNLNVLIPFIMSIKISGICSGFCSIIKSEGISKASARYSFQ